MTVTCDNEQCWKTLKLSPYLSPSPYQGVVDWPTCSCHSLASDNTVGNSVEATWSALMSEGNGVDYIKNSTRRSFPSGLPLRSKTRPLQYIAKRRAAQDGRLYHYAIAAATEAMVTAASSLLNREVPTTSRKRRH